MKRKPLQSLVEPPSISDSDTDMEIEFDPQLAMASTCNFKALKNQMKSNDDLQFEPPSSSTCNFKNMKQNIEKNGILSILDETEDESDTSESVENEKLFSKFLDLTPDANKLINDWPNHKNLSKLLSDEQYTHTHFKGGNFLIC